MLHLGDITKINGADVPPVNVVIGGSPCQDLSVAGKRAGLSGERSGLFIEQLRIIKEMRRKDIENGAVITRPRYMVWENVPGAFSSNKGEDFRIVLEETAKVVEPTATIPRPEKGKWANSGAVMGDGWSIAWRVFDAQFWGVPQRRRRIALVADFGGFTAPEILFERKGLSGDSEESGTPWEEFTRIVAQRFNSADRKSTGAGIAYSFDSLSSNSMKSNNPNSGCREADVAKTVDTTISNPSKNQGGICILNDQGGSVMGVQQNVDKSPTLRAETHGHVPTVYDARGNGDGGTVPTITGDHQNRVTDYTALCVRERCDCEGGGKGCLIQNEKSGTLAVNNDQFVVGSLCARDYKGVGTQYVQENKLQVQDSAVRRLTPLECERLQGFPDGWTDIGNYTDTNGKKRKTSDSARYKALGNSIALPSWVWVLERLARCCGSDYTMASLFDGIGGFSLIWETLNGQGTCLWASEIDEFPIAVTKRRFS